MERERRAQGHVGLGVQRTDGDSGVRAPWGADGRLQKDKKRSLLLQIIPPRSRTLCTETSGPAPPCPPDSRPLHLFIRAAGKGAACLGASLLPAIPAAWGCHTVLGDRTGTSQPQLANPSRHLHSRHVTFSKVHLFVYLLCPPAKQRLGRINPSPKALQIPPRDSSHLLQFLQSLQQHLLFRLLSNFCQISLRKCGDFLLFNSATGWLRRFLLGRGELSGHRVHQSRKIPLVTASLGLALRECCHGVLAGSAPQTARYQPARMQPSTNA